VLTPSTSSASIKKPICCASLRNTQSHAGVDP
jgi:hypothetical protein